MDKNQSYIDLRDGSESHGNGPRPGVAMPMPPLPSATRNNNVLIVVIVVASFLVLLSIISSMVFGFVFFTRATGQAQQMHIMTAEDIMAFQTMEVWSRDFGEYMEVWSRDFGNEMELWAEDFASHMTVWAEAWTPEVWTWDIDGVMDWTLVNEFNTWADIVDEIYIIFGTSDVRILPHNEIYFSFDGGDGWSFQAHHDAASGVFSVTDNQARPGGTLTMLVPHNWAGYLDIHTLGDIYISDDLPSGIHLNQRFMFVH
ncbi:MAG: hypothetical protein FWC76_03445 [Defluviitaleaceae bacterium]|nr:hypothetical protein [Defluviitaleaceae bacterium]